MRLSGAEEKLTGRTVRTASRSFRDRGKIALRRLFEVGQRAGFDVLPRHFYSAVPDIRQLRTTHSWRQPRSMAGVAGLDIAEQTAILRKWLPESLRSRLAARDIYAEVCEMNGAVGYGPTEAVLLYAFIATQRPSHVLQVGAGVSTAVILAAADDFGLDLKVSCVDPYPTALLRRLAAAGRIDLIEERGQTSHSGPTPPCRRVACCSSTRHTRSSPTARSTASCWRSYPGSRPVLSCTSTTSGFRTTIRATCLTTRCSSGRRASCCTPS